jgi:hypothetical protein
MLYAVTVSYIHVGINDNLNDLPDLYGALHMTKTGYFQIPSL